MRERIAVVARPAACHEVFPVQIEGDRITRFGIVGYPVVVEQQVVADGMLKDKLTLKATIGFDGNNHGIFLTDDIVFQIQDAAVEAQPRVVAIQVAL